MSEFWDVDEVPSSARQTQSGDVDEQDWDSLFSTRILKKTGIRLADRAEANTE